MTFPNSGVADYSDVRDIEGPPRRGAALFHQPWSQRMHEGSLASADVVPRWPWSLRNEQRQGPADADSENLGSRSKVTPLAVDDLTRNVEATDAGRPIAADGRASSGQHG